MNCKWTDERTEVLKEMWQRGCSSGTIARELGVTRNSVIGRVRRLNLDFRDRKTVIEASRTERWGIGYMAKTAGKKRTKRPTKGGKVSTFNPPFGNTERKPPSLPQLFPGQKEYICGSGIGLLDLAEGCCLWAINEREGWEEHLFCGAKAIKGLPYCGYHFRMAYQPAGERRRDSTRHDTAQHSTT